MTRSSKESVLSSLPRSTIAMERDSTIEFQTVLQEADLEFA